MKTKIIEKKFRSDPKALPEAEEFFIKTLKKVELSEERFQKLILAISEAVSNSVKHGNKSNPQKFVKSTIKINDDEIEIIFEDEGSGFNPDDVPDPTVRENILKESGRGIHIMRAFVDELKYDFSEKGTKTILIVRIKEKNE